MVFNTLCVWLLTGLWHGAEWNFLLWGLFLFLILTAEKTTGLGKRLERCRVAGHLYMLLLIPLSWLLFAVSDPTQLLQYAGRLIGIGGENVFARDFIDYGRQYGPFLLLGLVCCTGLPERAARALRRRPAVLGVGLLVLLAASVYCIYQGMNDPFLYFRF